MQEPPLTRLIWVVYNTLGMRAPHPEPMSQETRKLCQTLQAPYWHQRRKEKFGR